MEKTQEERNEAWYQSWRNVMAKEAALEQAKEVVRQDVIKKQSIPLGKKEKRILAKKAATSIADKKMKRWIKKGIQPKINHIFWGSRLA